MAELRLLSVALVLLSACAPEFVETKIAVARNQTSVCENARVDTGDPCIVVVGAGGFVLSYRALEPCERVEVLELDVDIASDPSFNFEFGDLNDVCSEGFDVVVRREALINEGTSAELNIRMRTFTETFDTKVRMLTQR